MQQNQEKTKWVERITKIFESRNLILRISYVHLRQKMLPLPIFLKKLHRINPHEKIPYRPIFSAKPASVTSPGKR